MTNLAIRGHAARGNEVIGLLEILGGKNIYKLDGKKDLWYILSNSTIEHATYCFQERGYTLEEFFKEFPYKVGDKVLYKTYGIYLRIKSMLWNEEKERVVYRLDSNKLFVATADELQPYKEETMEEQNEKSVNHVYENEVISFDIAQKDKYELDLQGKFEVKLRDGKYFVERIKPQYPKTYEECCKELGHPQTLLVDRILGYKGTLLSVFRQLRICRDAYWKIAGEQMGLGKPWKPDYKNPDIDLYVIINIYNQVQKARYGYGFQYCLFAFPTEEMRDAFIENFKELIEQCKELL